MKSALIWMIATAMLATAGVQAPEVEAAGVPGVSKPTLKRFRTRQRIVRRKGKRTKSNRVRPFGGCFGTSLVTQTDELGNPIFPRSIAPITSQSFVFANDARVTAPQFRDQFPRAALRAVSILDDPPMFTITNVVMGSLVNDPGSGTVVGAAPLTNDNVGIARCPVVPGDCTVIRDLGNRWGVADVVNLGGGEFAVLRFDDDAHEMVSVVTSDGDEIVLLTFDDLSAAYPFGFFPRALAAHDGMLYLGGAHAMSPNLSERRAVVVRVPLGGGEIEELDLELGEGGAFATPGAPTAEECAARFPTDMTFLGGDLVVASAACIGTPLHPESARPSRLLRVRLSTEGDVLGTNDIPVDVDDGFVNIQDLEALDGQLFLVDSRQNVSPMPIGLAGRILRVCP